MKKNALLTVLTVIVLIAAIFTLTGCGNKKEDTIDKKKVESTQKEKDNNAESEDKTENDKDKETATVEHEYDYKDGVLTQVVDEEGNPKQIAFVVDGIVLIGNRHSYIGLDAESGDIVEKLVKQGYKKEGINSSFYLNEYIQFYLDTKYTGPESDIKILVTPHKTVEEYEKMSSAELTELAEEKGFVMDYQKPDADNYNYVGENYVNIDLPEGKYDILFTYKGKLAYFINVDLTKEVTE